MNTILLGAPGAGKGTQAVKCAEYFGIPHISTGDIFRKNIKEKTEIGLLALGYINQGKLVPDEVTIEIVRLRLNEADCKNGYLLDGFPRTLAQAEALANLTNVEKVINIDVPLSKLLARLTSRRVCTVCGNSYSVDLLNGRNCLSCGGEMYQRDDDNEKTVSSRLNVYVEQTQPLIDFYAKQGVMVTINGDQDIDQVFEEIKAKV